MNTAEAILFAKAPKYHSLIQFTLRAYITEQSKALLIYDCIEVLRTALSDYAADILSEGFEFTQDFIMQAANVLAVYIQAGMFNYLLDRG